MNKFVLGLIVLVVVVAGYMALTGNDAPEAVVDDAGTASVQDAVEAEGGEMMEEKEGDAMMEEGDGHMEGEEHMEEEAQ